MLMRSTDHLKYEAITSCNFVEKLRSIKDIQVTIHTSNMGKNLKKTCNVCFKSMRGNNLKRHMKKHERGNEYNFITSGLYDGKTEDNILTKGPQIRYTDEQFIALKKKVSAQMDEFDRKMELGRNLNKIMNESGYNENRLNNDMMDALKTYELHGKNMDMKDLEWRGWQMDLRQYLDKPCDRKVLWVVGKEGNEKRKIGYIWLNSRHRRHRKIF